MQTLAASSITYFTLELNSFDLHIILYIALKLYKIDWVISPGWGHLNSYLERGEFEH